MHPFGRAQKISLELLYDPETPCLCIYPWELEQYAKKILAFPCYIIHDSQDNGIKRSAVTW